MAHSRLTSQGKSRPLTPRDVIDEALRGYTNLTRREITDKLYGALRAKGMLNEND